jgi:hypothetical protein
MFKSHPSLRTSRSSARRDVLRCSRPPTRSQPGAAHGRGAAVGTSQPERREDSLSPYARAPGRSLSGSLTEADRRSQSAYQPPAAASAAKLAPSPLRLTDIGSPLTCDGDMPYMCRHYTRLPGPHVATFAVLFTGTFRRVGTTGAAISSAGAAAAHAAAAQTPPSMRVGNLKRPHIRTPAGLPRLRQHDSNRPHGYQG